MNLTDIYEPIQEDLGKVKEELKRRIDSDDRFAGPLKRYVSKNRGKLLRPALLVLSARAVESVTGKPEDPTNDCLQVGIGCPVISIATAIELIHTASLLHDDVLDNAEIRRHKPSVNSKWGDRTAILFGDCLFSLAFSILVHYQSIARILCYVTSKMCEAETMENLRKYDFDITEDEYLEIITKKTAFLLGASCQIGAMLTGANSEQQQALARYGINFGIAYQILDDLLNIAGSEEEAGKSLGDDLAQGKITLPMIYLRDISSSLLQSPPQLNIGKVSDRLSQEICKYLNKARISLDPIPDSVYRQSLEKLLQRVVATAGFQHVSPES